MWISYMMVFVMHVNLVNRERHPSESKKVNTNTKPFHMLHLDLFGPVNIMTINKKIYALVVVDDYTRFTWVYFLSKKDETP